jgi:predicted secreted protein
MLAGCGGAAEQPQPAPTVPAAPSPDAAAAANSGPPAATTQADAFAPIVLGDDAAQAAASGSVAAAPAGPQQRQAVLAAMMPLQIMLGTWRGITFSKKDNFNQIDAPSWVWDFQSDREHPALVMTSAEGPYFRAARLSFSTESRRFLLTTTDPDGAERRFEGTFTQAPEQVQGEDKTLQQTYTLELTEIEPAEARDQWRVVFNQQENNRYLLELYRKRGASFARFDTVSTQREGTSFALSDSDYGERKCVISGGLGTIQVSWQGKSYWVCCTGCQAAFNEDPATWIAEFEAREAGKE